MGKVKEHAKRAAILMAVVGFLFSSVAVTILYFVQEKNQKSTETSQQELLKQIQQQSQAKEPLNGYSATAFDSAGVTELKVETLTQGEGTTATASSTVNANYFGWTADGKIFDSTNKNGTATPIDFPLSSVIKGWTEGLTGVKQGSTVKLTIPADKAYGSVDKGSGQPVGPLMFIIEVKEVK